MWYRAHENEPVLGGKLWSIYNDTNHIRKYVNNGGVHCEFLCFVFSEVVGRAGSKTRWVGLACTAYLDFMRYFGELGLI